MTQLTDRSRRALAALSIAGPAGLDPLAIGRAVLRGEHRVERLDAVAKNRIGREIAESLAEQHLAARAYKRYVLPHWLGR
jgi:hypothetical protein